MSVTINLAEKYSKKIVDKFYTESVILGKTSKEYDWDGVKSIKVWTITTYPTSAYGRPANNPASTGTHARYGNTYEVEDTIQTMEIRQDRAVSLSVDKGNNTEQMLIKNSGIVMARELREQFVPEFDKYCLAEWANNRGGTTIQSSITKSNIVEEIFKHVTNIRNEGGSVDDAYCYIGETNYALLLRSDEFIQYGGGEFAGRNIEKGAMGKVRGLTIVPVPDSYLNASADEGVDGNNKDLTSDVQFMTVKKSVILAPTKIKDAKVHSDPVGISGALLEVRWMYDAFVLETKNKGVQVCFKTAPSSN